MKVENWGWVTSLNEMTTAVGGKTGKHTPGIMLRDWTHAEEVLDLWLIIQHMIKDFTKTRLKLGSSCKSENWNVKRFSLKNILLRMS